MSMAEWAENEVRIACEKENPNRKEGEFDYRCACYESALKAFKSLCEDGHSGYSIKIAQGILNRLINGRPLTPIEDTDDTWDDVTHYRGENGEILSTYQCSRMSSLFKDIYNDGTVKYYDAERCYCIDINNPSSVYNSSLVQRIVNEMFPIAMPYYPGKAMKVYCEDLLTDRKNGDFDTFGIFKIVKSDNETIQVNRFFKGGTTKAWDEIDFNEYCARKNMHNDRQKKEENERKATK